MLEKYGIFSYMYILVPKESLYWWVNLYSFIYSFIFCQCWPLGIWLQHSTSFWPYLQHMCEIVCVHPFTHLFAQYTLNRTPDIYQENHCLPLDINRHADKYMSVVAHAIKQDLGRGTLVQIKSSKTLLCGRWTKLPPSTKRNDHDSVAEGSLP